MTTTVHTCKAYTGVHGGGGKVNRDKRVWGRGCAHSVLLVSLAHLFGQRLAPTLQLCNLLHQCRFPGTRIRGQACVAQFSVQERSAKTSVSAHSTPCTHRGGGEESTHRAAAAALHN